MATTSLKPTSDGYYTQFAVRLGGTSHYLEVDDSTSPTGHDGSSTYVYASGTYKDSYGFETLSGSYTVNSVTVHAVVNESTDSTGTFKFLQRYNSTDSMSTSQATTATFTDYSYQFTTDAEGNAWTVSSVNASEFGIEATPSSKRQINLTQIYIVVDVTAAPSYLRLSNILVGDKGVNRRIANVLDVEKLEYLRLSNALVGEASSNRRLSNAVDFEYAGIYRPQGDTVSGLVGWTTYPASPTTSYDKLDEVTLNSDTDYIQSINSGLLNDSYAGRNFNTTNIERGKKLRITLYAKWTASDASQYVDLSSLINNISLSAIYTGTQNIRISGTTTSYTKFEIELDDPPWAGDWGSVDNIAVGFKVTAVGSSNSNYIRISQLYWEFIGKKEYLRLPNKLSLQLSNAPRLANAVIFPAYDPTWWNSSYFRRAPITFGTDHDTLPTGYTAQLEMLTGYEQRVASNGATNESIGHSGVGLAYDETNDVLYFSWLSWDVGDATLGVYVNYRDSSGTVGTAVKIATTTTSSDTHYLPSILLDNDGYLHAFYGSHLSQQLYRRTSSTSSTPATKIASWTTEAGIGSSSDEVTYPRPIVTEDGNIFLFVRGNYTDTMGFYKSTDNGSTWGSYTTVVNYAANFSGVGSVYCGGLIYKDGRCHIVVHFYDDYGTTLHPRAISYIYSDYNATSETFVTWHSADGTSVGSILYYDEADKIYLSSDAEWTTTADGPYYHTNAQGLAVDNDKRPYFLCQKIITDIRDSCDLLFARWDGSQWVKTNLSADVTGGQQMMGYRMGGVLYWDNTTVYCYAFVPPSTSEEYYGGELFCWRGMNNGTSWSAYYLTQNSAYGAGMINVTPEKYDDQYRTLIYARCEEIFLLEDRTYPYIQADGEDIRIVRSIKNGDDSYTSTEIDRLPDRWNAEDSLISFGLDASVPEDKDNPHTYNRYWVYYNNYSATNPARDVDNVFVFYDGFESYVDSSDVNGQGGWSGTSGVFTIENMENSHANKIYDGMKSVIGYATLGSDNYLEQNISVDSHEITGYIRSASASYGAYLKIRDSATGKWFKIGSNLGGATNVGAYMRSGDAGFTAGTTNIGYLTFHKFTIRVTSSGVTAYVDDELLVSNDTHMTSADYVGFGFYNPYYTATVYFDRFMVKKYVANEPECSLGSIEGSTNTDHSRIANIADPAYFRDIRVAHDLDLELSKSIRLSNLTDLEAQAVIRLASTLQMDKAKAIRLAMTLIADKAEAMRLANTMAVDKTDLLRLSNELTLEAVKHIRLAQSLSGDKEWWARLSNSVTADKANVKRVANFIDTDKTLTARVANTLGLDKYKVKRIANALGLDKATVIRICHLLVMDKNDYLRLANTLDLQYVDAVRIANSLAMDKEATFRLAHLVPVSPTGAIRIANALGLDKYEVKRIANTLSGDKAESIRLSNALSGDKTLSARLANLIDLEEDDAIRLANILDLDKAESVRLSNIIVLDAISYARLANLVPLGGDGYIRIAHSVVGDKTEVVRLAHTLGLDANKIIRLSNTVTLEAETYKRLANMVGLEYETYLRLSNILTLDSTNSVRLANLILFSIVTGISIVDPALTVLKLSDRTLKTLNFENEALASLNLKDLNINLLTFNNEELKTLDLKDSSLDT